MSSEAGSSIMQKRRRKRFVVVGDPFPGESLSSPVKKRKPTTLSVGEQEIVINIYKYVKNTWPKDAYPSNTKMVEKTSEISGVSKSTIYRILGTYRDSHAILVKGIVTKKKKNMIDKLNDFEKSAIRSKVHQYFVAGQLPNLNNILHSINEDDQLPNLSKSTLRRVLRHFKFKFIGRSAKTALIDHPDTVVWRTGYLEEIQRLRYEGRRIFYLDETWINAGHTVGKVWEDKSANLLVVVHIGNEKGFLEDCQWIFESTTGDHHESMDASQFEEWFAKVLSELQSSDVIVMDNASYHSRKFEKTPTMSWQKENIREWLDSKEISYEPSESKAQLIKKVKLIKHNYESFVTDEMAKEKGVTVLRLPPYHCELNPIELVWADVKEHIARNNTTKQLTDVKQLLMNGLAQVTPHKWKNCVEQVLIVEEKMRGLDAIIDRAADKLITNVTDSSSGSSSEDLGSDSE